MSHKGIFGILHTRLGWQTKLTGNNSSSGGDGGGDGMQDRACTGQRGDGRQRHVVRFSPHLLTTTLTCKSPQCTRQAVSSRAKLAVTITVGRDKRIL
ncbi:hypothetical protein E2C01_021568 [Portunus trituberculatus]|uniref:Uncharacterized protein n=1 Tax=Portunus trituberculatus TaxID=210409 RepID=A0A5B7E4Q5_PORTR|nr:hypothetical protein [Portunus trituberculatus]